MNKPPALPVLLTLNWWWLLAAIVVVQVLRVWLHWRPDTAATVEVVVFEFWSLVQSGWLKKADARSKAVYWNMATMVLSLVSSVRDHSVTVPDGVDAILGIVTAAFSITSIFVFRSEMQRYFNDRDNVGLKLSPWMTFFFSTFYFQYHFHEIAEFKKRHSEPAEA